MSARLVAFDLDGTLVDSTRDLATAVNRALVRVAPGTPALDLEVVRRYIGEGARRLISRCLEHAGLAHLDTGATLSVFLEAYRGCLLDTTTLYPGVADTLARLAQAPAPPFLAVLTNKPGDLSRTILRGLGVEGRFARVVGGGDGPTRKPDPAGLVALMADFGAGPRATALVGDSAVDVATARAAGVLAVGVSYGLDPEGLRAAGPDVVLDDLRALPAYLERMTVLG